MKQLFFAGILAGAITCSGVTLSISTYLRDCFTPSASASDAQGNLYLAGAPCWTRRRHLPARC